MTTDERLSELAALPWDWDMDMDGKSPAPVPDAASVEAARDVVRVLAEHGFTVTAEDVCADVMGGMAVTIDDGASREAWFSALNGVRTIVTLSDASGPVRVESDYLSDATLAQTVAFLRGGPMLEWRR